jgi:hypothetical protein
MHVEERHEDPVAGRLDDRRDRTLPAQFHLTGEREPPPLNPPDTDHRGVRAVGPHAGRVEV